MRLATIPLRRLLLILSLGGLLPVGVILAWDWVELRRARTAEVDRMAERASQLAAAEIRQVFAGVENLLLAVGEGPGVAGGGPGADAACAAYLARIGPKLPYLDGLIVLDGAGHLRCGSTDAMRDGRYDDRGYFRQAWQTGRFTVGEYTIGRHTSQPVLPLAAPVLDAQGHVVAVVAASLDLRWFGNRLKERGLPPGGALTIADRNGVIISREPFPERFIGTTIPAVYLRLVRGAAPGAEEVLSQDGTPRVIGYIPATDPTLGLYVSAGLSDQVEFGAVDAARLHGLAALLVLGVAVAIAAWYIGRRLIQAPMEHILGVLRAWRDGVREARTNMQPGGGEFGELGAACDALLDAVAAREAARAQSEAHRELLLAELNHRVKNTLAVVQAVAQQSFRVGVDPVAAQRSFAERLRAMARAHDLLTNASWNSAGLRDVVDHALALLPAGRVSCAGPELRIRPRAALALAMALHELGTNAQKYGALSDEAGRVALTWRCADGTLDMTWQETGGPAVTPPARSGFGTRLIGQALAAELGGSAHMDFRPAGLVCHIAVPTVQALEDTALQAA